LCFACEVSNRGGLSGGFDVAVSDDVDPAEPASGPDLARRNLSGIDQSDEVGRDTFTSSAARPVVISSSLLMMRTVSPRRAWSSTSAIRSRTESGTSIASWSETMTRRPRFHEVWERLRRRIGFRPFVVRILFDAHSVVLCSHLKVASHHARHI